MGCGMRNSSYFRIKSLILFFLFSVNAYSSPFLNSSYFSVYEGLVGAGVSSENAKRDSEKIIRSSFFPDHKFNTNLNPSTSSSSQTNQGETPTTTLVEDLFSKGLQDRISMSNSSGKSSFFFNASHYGTEQDRRIIENYWQNELGSSIKFVEQTNYSEIENELNFFKANPLVIDGREVNNAFSDGTLDIAPAWYGLLGRRVYRTYDKLLTYKGEDLYVYFDDVFSAYTYGADLSFFDMKFNSVMIDVYPKEGDKEFKFEVYEEHPEAYEGEADAKLADDPLFNVGSTRVKEAHYVYFSRISSLGYATTLNDSMAEYQDQKYYCEQNVMESSGSVDKDQVLACLMLHKKDLTGDEIEGRMRYVQTLQYGNIDELPINANEEYEYEEFKKISSLTEKLNAENFRQTMKDYIVSDDSQAGLINEAIKNTDLTSVELSQETRDLIRNGFNVSALDVEKARANFGSSISSSSYVSGGDMIEDLKNSWDSFLQTESSRIEAISKKETGSSDNVGIDSASGTAIEGETNGGNGDNRPVGGTTTSPDSGATSGSGSISGGGSSTAPIGGNTGTVAKPVTNSGGGAASGSSSSTTNTGAVAKPNEGAVGANNPAIDEPKEDESDFRLPTLEDFDVLKPIREWRDTIIGSLQINVGAGVCPELSMNIFDKEIGTDIHCVIYDRLAPIIGSFSALLWLILGFRILFSA